MMHGQNHIKFDIFSKVL